MKKILSLLFVMTLLFALTGCASSEDTTEGEELATVLTWQEQYDLGMKYLGEGNYQEAIIAFEAAIALDPKQADVYLALADAYVAMGDEAQAAAVLEQGLAAVDDSQLQEKLEGLLEAETLDEQDRAPDATTVQTTSTAYYPQVYGSAVDLALREDTSNPGAVAMCEFYLTWDDGANGDIGQYPIDQIMIASWQSGGFTTDEVNEQIELYGQVWSSLAREASGEVYDIGAIGMGFPVWEEDLGTTTTVLLMLETASMDCVGYMLVDVAVPAN